MLESARDHYPHVRECSPEAVPCVGCVTIPLGIRDRAEPYLSANVAKASPLRRCATMEPIGKPVLRAVKPHAHWGKDDAVYHQRRVLFDHERIDLQAMLGLSVPADLRCEKHASPRRFTLDWKGHTWLTRRARGELGSGLVLQDLG